MKLHVTISGFVDCIDATGSDYVQFQPTILISRKKISTRSNFHHSLVVCITVCCFEHGYQCFTFVGKVTYITCLLTCSICSIHSCAASKVPAERTNVFPECCLFAGTVIWKTYRPASVLHFVMMVSFVIGMQPLASSHSKSSFSCLK
mmetsp:Transcript_20113/g.55768  ORF Transcript_20113/g.55768 Transcript_20113/m.55768 type:complete len:147 (-) Transcript_20113:323-763(-)